jgi:hypothetical protein
VKNIRGKIGDSRSPIPRLEARDKLDDKDGGKDEEEPKG